MKKTPKIILDIETTHSYGRGLIEGIVKYSQTHGPWAFFRPQPFYADRFSAAAGAKGIAGFKPDGIIIREPRNIDEYLAMGIAIIVSPNRILPYIPCIETDAAMIGEMAAGHFLDRGFKKFAYCGFDGIGWSEKRFEAFQSCLSVRGLGCVFFGSTVQGLSNPLGRRCQALEKWLRGLEKPVAVMCCNDDMGRIVLEACKKAQIAVPNDVAVIGVDDDELVCELTDPPLSSISLDARKAGFEAAALLDRLMNGEKMNSQVILHRPCGVATRRSSDFYAVSDSQALKAAAYITANCRRPIQVGDVADAAGLSQRQLFNKFKTAFGCSVHSRIKAERIERIKTLLTETNLSISAIADAMGFADQAHISRYFSRQTGMNLSQYRKNR